MARDEVWDALKDHAKQVHQERVAKNPDRIAYAIQQFEAHGIEYQLKNEQTGHFHCWRKSEGAYVLSARKFNSEMERHPEWFDCKSTSSGFMIYWGLKLKEVV